MGGGTHAVVAPIERGITRLQSLRGASSHQTSPFAAVINADCTEERGECYGVQLVYSGSFAITAEKTFGGAVRLQGGVNDTNFEWVLGAGESFTAPQALLCYSGEGLGELSREYADFLREHIINPQYAYKHRPIVANNWEATYFDFDSDKICAIIDEAAELGIDTFVLDDGWFGARNSDKAGLGDWAVNEQKLSGGLQTLIERCKRNGMRFGLWFEPECVNEDSDLYRAHPDWAIGKTGVEPCRHRNQLVLDFTRKEVVDHIFAAVSNILSAYEISYVKWDFNRSISEFYSQTLGSCQGAFAHKYMLGVYDLAPKAYGGVSRRVFRRMRGRRRTVRRRHAVLLSTSLDLRQHRCVRARPYSVGNEPLLSRFEYELSCFGVSQSLDTKNNAAFNPRRDRVVGRVRLRVRFDQTVGRRKGNRKRANSAV